MPPVSQFESAACVFVPIASAASMHMLTDSASQDTSSLTKLLTRTLEVLREDSECGGRRIDMAYGPGHIRDQEQIRQGIPTQLHAVPLTNLQIR